MHWTNPSWLWAQVLPLLALSVAVTGFSLQRRRLARFGDPQILHLSAHGARRAMRILLTAAGIACVTAVLAGPYWREPKALGEVPSTKILIDFRLEEESGREAERRWQELCDSVDLLLSQAPTSRFSVFLAKAPVELLVPDTFDAQGLLLVLNGAFSHDRLQSPGKLRDALASLPAGMGEEPKRIVIVSTRTREELADLRISADPAVGPLFLRVVQETGLSEFAVAPVRGDWVWSSEAKIMRSYLDATSGDGRHPLTPWDRLSAVQLFAFAGFLFLAADSALPFIRLRNRGMNIG